MTIKISKSRVTCLVGLALEGRRLEGSVLRRVKDSLLVEKSFATTLSVDPLTGDVALVGKEIRKCLDAAGIRERRCVVGVPLEWVLTLQAELPGIAQEDVGDFMDIQAEQGFPCSPEDLCITTSQCRSSAGRQFATLVAIPKYQQLRLEEVLVAAGMKPASFSLLVSTLQPQDDRDSDGVLALVAGETGVDLQITCGGGTMALRFLHGVTDVREAERRIDADYLNREIRLTLSHLPEEFRKTVKIIRVFGRPERIQSLVRAIMPCATRLGLSVEMRDSLQTGRSGVTVPLQQPAVAIAARFLDSRPPVFEFMPPKVTAWQDITSRFSSGKILWIGAAACIVIMCIAGAFLVQHVKLSILESRWHAIESRVSDLEDMQANIVKFRPWFDHSVRTLTMLRKLTEVFPEDGVVVAKTVEIRDLSEVTCSGSAQDYQAFLKMLDRLRQSNQVKDIKTPQLRGRSPLQFTLNYRWMEGGNREDR